MTYTILELLNIFDMKLLRFKFCLEHCIEQKVKACLVNIIAPLPL